VLSGLRLGLRRLRLAALAALVSCSACAGNEPAADEPTLIEQPTLEFPASLSEVGLYQNLAEQQASPRAIPYTPRAALWSNGLAKRRYVVVPAGESIDARTSEWVFPEGTLMFKTFLGDDGPVETRVVRTTNSVPEFATYRWDGDEAYLLDGERGVDVEVSVDGDSTAHEIPSNRSCEQCHESATSPVLGFTPLELSGEARETLEQVERLVSAGVIASNPKLDGALDEFAGTQRDVLSYLVGNCVHCHNDSGGIASSFDLRPEVAFDALIDQPTASSASAAGIRVVPGKPEESILFQAVSGETDDPEVKSMPPVGVQRRDREGIELLRGWIAAL